MPTEHRYGTLKRWLGLDSRSLAMTRIGFGAIILLDLFLRGLHFKAHYTSEGILPLRLFLAQPDISFRMWSVYYLNDSPLFVGAVFLLTGMAAFSLMIGYRTRLAAWTTWFLLLSLHHRNPLVLNKGDSYLLLILFFLSFTNWGEVFSVDSKGSKLSDPRHLSWGGTAYMLQVCMLYWFSAVYRTDPLWNLNGDALYYAFNLEPLLTPLAPPMLALGLDILAFFTIVVLVLEVVGPFVLLLPFQSTRLLSVVLIIAFHVSIVATLRIPVFAPICVIACLGLSPPMVWNSRPGRWLESRLHRPFKRLSGRVPDSPISSEPGRWYRIVPALALILTSYYCLAELSGRYRYSPEMNVIRAAGLDQRWGMFSPRPPLYFGWQSAKGHTESGRTVELISGQDYPSDSALFRQQYRLMNQRWSIYHTNLTLVGFGAHAELYLEYLAHAWNREHPDDPVVWGYYIMHGKRIRGDYKLGYVRPNVLAQYHR